MVQRDESQREQERQPELVEVDDHDQHEELVVRLDEAVKEVHGDS